MALINISSHETTFFCAYPELTFIRFLFSSVLAEKCFRVPIPVFLTSNTKLIDILKPMFRHMSPYVGTTVNVR